MSRKASLTLSSYPPRLVFSPTGDALGADCVFLHPGGRAIEGGLSEAERLQRKRRRERFDAASLELQDARDLQAAPEPAKSPAPHIHRPIGGVGN